MQLAYFVGVRPATQGTPGVCTHYQHTTYFAASVHVVHLSSSAPAPALQAPLTDGTVCEEQTPLQSSIAAQAPSNQSYQPVAAHSGLRFGELETQPTFFGWLSIDPSLPRNLSLLNEHPNED